MTRGAESKQHPAQRERRKNNNEQRTKIFKDYFYSDDYRRHHRRYCRSHCDSRCQRTGGARRERRWNWAPLRPILLTIISVIEIIAGAKGLKACKVPENAGKCVTWGIVIAVLSIISMVIGLIGGGEFNITSLVLNLLVPGLYVYGALKTKPNVNA